MTADAKPADAKPPSSLDHLISTFGGWLKRRRELNELRQLDCAEFEHIAGDLQISPGALEALVEKGPHAADELEKLLQALGIDEARLARTQPMVLRDMERVCALCSHKRECDQDIAAGKSTERYEDYCPNTSTIAGLDEKAAH
jgi:transcriptional regulator with XRE-family HTH domain